MVQGESDEVGASANAEEDGIARVSWVEVENFAAERGEKHAADAASHSC